MSTDYFLICRRSKEYVYIGSFYATSGYSFLDNDMMNDVVTKFLKQNIALYPIETINEHSLHNLEDYDSWREIKV
jgi:hypothetical protein